MTLQEKWEANEARKAFNIAFAAFKAESVQIIKGSIIKDGPLKGKAHADLFDVVSAVTPALSKHGLSTAWRLTKDDPSWMEVTCTLSHVAGYSESASMGGAPDTGPGRNAIQARGSVKTYLERYTLTGILGLAAQDADDDGNGSGGGKKEEKKETNKPTAGAVERITDNLRLDIIIATAEAIKERMSMDDVIGAYELNLEITDADERVAMWSLIPDSKMRSAIKAHGLSLRKQATAEAQREAIERAKQ
jgi:hypothetical protein